jgi:hypothetical protein
MNKEIDGTPKWLKKLQENSWELELLISGGAIFSLYQFSDYYIDWIQHIRMTNHFPGAGILLMIGMIGIKMLTLGFTLHLIFRGFWISLVCINYVYPKGINEEKVKWKKPYRKKSSKLKNLKDQIIKVDHVCGTTLYTSIISAFSIVGISIALVFIFGILIIFEFNSFTTPISNIMLVALVVYILDFLTCGLIRKIPVLSYISFPFFKLFDLLTFRDIYQKSLLLFNTNIHRLKFTLLALIFSSASILFAYNSLYRTMHWPNLLDDREYRFQLSNDFDLIDLHYMDNWNESTVKTRVGISSKIIKGNYLEIYLRYDKVFDPLIELTHDSSDNRLFSKLVTVSIDSSHVKNLNWLPSKKLSNQIGISAMIPLNEFENGRHTIYFHVNKKYIDAYSEIINRDNIINIPFWLDRINYSNSRPIDADSLTN